MIPSLPIWLEISSLVFELALPSSSLLHVLAISPPWTPGDPLQTSKGTVLDSYMASPLNRTASPPGPRPTP